MSAARPEHLIALGGNYLGLEFGQMFGRLGSKVARIRGLAKPERSARSRRHEISARIKSHQGGQKGRRTGGHGREEGRGHRDAGRTHLLMAIGQVPNSDDLGLDKAGVATDKNGYIAHNGKLETNVPGIWVLGDVKVGPASTW